MSTDILRDDKGHFLPGQSPNPSGRPKLSTTITSEVINILESDVSVKREIARKWVETAGKPEHRAYHEALQSLLDRTEGKVADKHLIQGVIMHVGNEYAQLGLEANKQDLEQRQTKYLVGPDPDDIPF